MVYIVFALLIIQTNSGFFKILVIIVFVLILLATFLGPHLKSCLTQLRYLIYHSSSAMPPTFTLLLVFAVFTKILHSTYIGVFIHAFRWLVRRSLLLHYLRIHLLSFILLTH